MILFMNNRCKLEKQINLEEAGRGDRGLYDRKLGPDGRSSGVKKNSCAPLIKENMIGWCARRDQLVQGIENHKHQQQSDDLDENDDVPGDHIPGLENAIEIFQEVFMWPSRFPKMFECSALRNQVQNCS